MIRMSTPLIDAWSMAVVYRLDQAATWANDPPGSATTGFDPIFKEPRVSYEGGYRRGDTLRYDAAPIKIPCQLEFASWQQLNMTFGGDKRVTRNMFVFHRKTLAKMGLLDANMTCTLKPMDKIVRVEDIKGRTVLQPDKDLFIYEIRPGSAGFGSTGYDLELVYTTHDPVDPRSG